MGKSVVETLRASKVVLQHFRFFNNQDNFQQHQRVIVAVDQVRNIKLDSF